MYKILLLLVFLLAFAGCCEYSYYDYSYLTGPHQLHQINTTPSQIKSSSGAYFLIFAIWESTEREQSYVHFYWKHPKRGHYIFSKVIAEKVRFVVDNNIEIPTVKFVGAHVLYSSKGPMREEVHIRGLTGNLQDWDSWNTCGLEIYYAEITCNGTQFSKQFEPIILE